jgi:hypothetical protein
MKTRNALNALQLLLLTLTTSSWAASTINSTNAYSYGANIGWMNWRHNQPAAGDGIIIGEFICSGYIYGANVGWINMGNGAPANGIQYSNSSNTDFGVNYGVDSTQPNFAVLRGFAYGANIGWINFESQGNPRINLMTGALEGYAYGANVGWINLGEPGNHFLVTDHVAMGVDTDADGIADAYELSHTMPPGLAPMNGNTDSDGDGVSDLNEYLEGTDAKSPNDNLRITLYTEAPHPPSSRDTNITFTSTTARLYRIETNLDLNPLNWADSGLGIFAPNAGNSTARTIIHSAETRRFYRVKSIRPLP